ncbi:Adenosylmethionine-8-amino-7-oxononanoate aminotransferase [Liberibacter crescens BT-1]|uniref:Adenosylmethionine-8-amino-7-oxononanoate aminotransferase n=1 Tax=Liberibacter crescens (strain BT-1) TaxID=1215343 RepID=L0EUU1_LIBCB|nr:adenosylmethionine--8-amino-7-oxononanoate transaminase [Liberibacter crescens]AGA65319.1 Adenosylmethionine-8-amino-7-oxononanoate aminotransferase [Liberibacter crescens BT-1]AMC13248.1 adenosylmethionine-8-amino-7-oxononanoate aminotransferase [Liberibacter crescens]
MISFHPQRSPIWHPFTQHFLHPTWKRIISTKDAYLIDEDGFLIFDAISSWWVITHGHRHPTIMNAIQNASTYFDQIIFSEYTHEPAENLAQGLIRIAPPGLSYVFFSDSGSTSVEVALKMALGFFYNNGTKRTQIIVMEHGYHGDTIGTMSAGAHGVFNTPYEPLLFNVNTIPFPSAGHEQDSLDALEKFCCNGTAAAFLIEPLVLGAGGMKMYPPYLLKEFRKITQHYGTLLIADEVMTGWGRTGTIFACNHVNVTPDILCISKGITGGALPLAATLCSTEIFDAHVSPDQSRMFFHSSSYTANPIACAAAVANLNIWENEPVIQRIAELEKMHSKILPRFQSDQRFINVRQMGTIAALDLNTEKKGYFSDVGLKLRTFFRKKNLLIRPLGNIIYLMPPYCTTLAELIQTYEAINEAADIVETIK